MIGRSRPQSGGSVQSTAITIVSLVMLIAAGLSNTYAQASSSPAAWIQVGKGTGPAKVSVRAASAAGATVTIEIPGIQTESVAIYGAQYTKLTIPGAVSTGWGVGKAEVPSIPVLLARPTGSAVTFRVISIQTETLHVARVFPMQPPQKSGEQAGPLVVDNSFYASDVDYPPIRLGSPSLATWRDLDVVNVHVYPVVVRPARHEVIVTSRITFRADFSGGRYPRKVASWMPPLYRRLIRNYDDLRLTPTSIDPPGTKCLMFCYDDYVENQALLGLRATMSMLGDSTELVPVKPQTSPESIKQVIMQRYVGQGQALRWVFLIGKYNQISPRAEYWRPEWGDSTVSLSDYWYSDLEDLNNLDSCDNYPEVGIARLSPGSGTCDPQIDLSNQVAKIIDYMTGEDGGGWLDTITLVAHQADSFAAAVRAVDTMSLSYHDYTRDTIMGYDGDFSNTSIKTAVRNGTGVLIYHGHGEWNKWAEWSIADPPDNSWTIGEVASLENERTPVVFNICCYCGDLTHGTCLSEEWMRKYDSLGKGAVASLGSTDKGWIPVGNAQCSMAVRAIGHIDTVQGPVRRYTAPVLDLGGIKMLMDADIATKWDTAGPGQGLFTQSIYSFMWLGNPAMQVWSGGIPETADVTYPSGITSGAAQDFTVSVEINGQHVEGAQVCARKDGDFCVVGSTDSSGTVTLSLPASSPGTFSVAASKGHARDLPHTPMLPYFGTAVVRPSYSTPEMTYPNWSRKLARAPGTNTLHVVYTGDGSVFYTQSTNAGDSWTAPELVGAGSCPAIALHEGWSGLVPWVVYLTPDSSIVRAIRDEGSSPPWDAATIFQGSSVDGRAGAPSLAAGYYAGDHIGNVTYPVHVDSTGNNFICFNWFTTESTSPRETLDAAGTTYCYGASVDVTPLNLIHVAWARGESAYYRQRDTGWSPPFRISQFDSSAITEPASNPSVEAYGDSVFCVWHGPNDIGGFPGDVWRRSRLLSVPVSDWRPVANQSQSLDRESDFPVMTTSLVTVWQEQVPPDNTQIWIRMGYAPGPSCPLIQMPMPSCYPQVDGYGISPYVMWFRLYTLWTQQTLSDPPRYELGFDRRDYIPALGKGLGPSPDEDYEPALYYAAKLGKPEQSPYCLSRGGFAQFESCDADTSATGLIYQLPYLDPLRVYKLCAVLYHEGDGTWNAQVRCDSGPWHGVRVAPRVADTFWLQVPKRCYKNDARVVVELTRATGKYVSLAKLKVFQIEEEAGGSGGVQSVDYGHTFVTRLRGCTPNPFTRGTSVYYELANTGPATLTIHDVSGRLVRRLESGPRAAGRHTARWDGTDARGHTVPAGVYFLRLSAGDVVSAGRLTLVR